MKKLNLDLSNFEGKEILSRSQLKKITGGNFGSGEPECVTICAVTDPDNNTVTEIWHLTVSGATFASCLGGRPVSACSCTVVSGGPECEE